MSLNLTPACEATMNSSQLSDAKASAGEGPAHLQLDFITTEEFARLARLSRRQIDRLRQRRASGFPREYELGSGSSKHRNCPRFRRTDVERWLESRALW